MACRARRCGPGTGQSTAELAALLREQVSDVLHIATDGVELPDGRQYLTLGDAASTDPLVVVVLISAAELLEMLRGVQPPGWSCSPGPTPRYWPRLARAVPAVVGMRGGISARGCESFLRGFYHALGRGEPLEAALMAGRAAQREIGGTLDTDWAAAVAYLSGPQRLTTRDTGDPLPDPGRAPEQSATGTAPVEGQTHAPGGLCTADRHGLALRMRKLDLAELLTRWQPIDSSFWPDVVDRGRADLDVAIAEASSGLDGPR